MNNNIDEKINEINKQIEEENKKKEYKLKKQQLENIKEENSNNKKTSTSKILTFFLFFNCLAIEIFTGYVTIMNLIIARELGIPPDLSPLIALIGAAIGQTIGFGIYSLKAAKENCRGGIVYEQAMIAANNNMLENFNNYNYNSHYQEEMYGLDN